MSLTQDRADPARAAPIGTRNERPETARPPGESDAPSDEALDADGLDIDALLPATFDTGSTRVAMGQDLVDLLRAAEERIEARAEPSRPLGSSEEGTSVPVPDDVLALLAEPLEGDDEEAATGANLGSSPGGTGADRLATNDGMVATPHGVEEDLEQPLPRASDIPREQTVARAMTGAGRADSTPPQVEAPRAEVSRAEAPRAAATTRPGIDEHPLRIEAPAARSSDRGSRRGPSDIPAAPMDRGTGSFDRTTGSFDRTTGSFDRTTGSFDRTTGSFDRAAPSLDRGTRSSDRAAPSLDRGTRSSDRAAPSSDRGAMAERGAAMVERAAMGERGADSPRGLGSERIGLAERAAMRTIEMRAIERPQHVEATRGAPARVVVSPAAAPVTEGGPRSRAAQTDAVPAVLGPGDAARALGRAIAMRATGALVVTSGDEQRRIMLHDGDVVTAGSGVPAESLVAFLAARGDIERDLVPRLAGKLPAFGRHAGAALVANGHLGQDDLWPVLRAHGEWIIGRALLVESGTCELEQDPPARFKAEPSVFGGATGAEVFVDVVQRVIAPEIALARLGGHGARLALGPRGALLGECALTPEEEDAVRAAPGRTVHDLFGDGPTERWSMLHALVCLDVLEALAAIAKPQRREESKGDPLDDEALRQRVRARLAIVEEGDYFALLGVPRAATSYEIRRAYLDLRRTLEPSRVLTAGTADLADDLRLVLEVVEEAYEILRDGNRRDRYRRAIEAGPPR